MHSAQADILAAREHLQRSGWIARRSEAFHHLPPPALEQWLGGPPNASTNASTCAAPPLTGAGWTLHPLDSASAGGVDAHWLDAHDPAQRAQLFAGLPRPGQDEAAPFAWAHRALCQQGLRIRIAARPGLEGSDTVWLALRHQPRAQVEAPLLVLELDAGVRCMLLETHERDAQGCQHAITQNLHLHVQLAEGARLEHVRIVHPGAADQLAQHVHARIGSRAHYAQALVAHAASYHLQRNHLQLEGAGASAHSAALLLAAAQAGASSTQIDQQSYSRVEQRHASSQVETLALAEGSARLVSNAHTRIAPGADEASVRQRLSGIALGGQPRLILRPHLEILHDKVQAAHGATWGALPQDALFYASQRGLSPAHARALVIHGMARALLERALPDSALLQQWLDGPGLQQALQTVNPAEVAP